MARYFFIFILILLAALSRLLPHPPNVAPITALALFGGVYLDKKHIFVVPIAAMLISDYFLGFHSEMIWVYASFSAIGLIGLWLRNHQGILTTVGATLVGSILFFVVTNFGVWLSPFFMYSRDLSGLIQCYLAAIPFFKNTLLGDIFYVGMIFGVFELAKRFIPSLNLKPNVL
ncbi:MAG: hypothetical protein KKF20_01155 [Bacteroidetes bacterium]|nr:hypothetical protein [Bacteroidota bacterium]MBU1421620.1 hypothetical protein [Bacteroidota bacterium]MBU2471001.1 hypothetical protein [Bacteroidota bacterium]MBU2636185.1 hypothetical protein [Bacteroidota bacterium]